MHHSRLLSRTPELPLHLPTTPPVTGIIPTGQRQAPAPGPWDTSSSNARYAEYLVASFSVAEGGEGPAARGLFLWSGWISARPQIQHNGLPAALLSWSTGVEENVALFEVERSLAASGMTWVSIGSAQPHNTAGIHSYTFTDPELVGLSVDKVCYRIRSVDVDGSISHSNIATLYVQDNMTLQLWPNPVREMLTISLSGRYSGGMLTLYDALGREALQQPLADSGPTEIAMHLLAQGLYSWRIVADGKAYTGTVVKE